MLELLIVIVIISILMALIIPAVGSSIVRARNAEVLAEFTRLETAISSFKQDFGVEPWSFVVLTEDPSATAWTSDSRTKLRRIWPQFTFSGTNDFNADGDTDDVLLVSASEALVFFLGGVRTSDGTLRGFSKNPINPFVVGGENRQGPYYEFDPRRLVDTDGDGMIEYVDTLPGQATPLLFVSGNNGQGYSKTDGSLAFYLQGDAQTAWKKDSHQLISPGADGAYGFDPGPTPFAAPVYSADTELTGSRLAEADNLTNFKAGGALQD
jgi:general secretion pathway protein G